jgi:hypothetical protein
MLDPFTAWMRLTDAWLDLSRTGVRAAETLSASHDVVRDRTDIIDAAMRNPLRGDYAELSRMVPEKLDAFSKAGTAVAGELWSMQAAFASEMQHLWLMALRGHAPGLADVERSASFALRTVERTAGLGRAGLAPIHKQATANARRLKRRRQPKR